MVHGSRCWILLSVALAACTADPGFVPDTEFDITDTHTVGSAHREIIGGQVTTGDPAVVGLYMQQGQSGGMCTGSLISPRVVMTAAHCVDGLSQPGPDGESIIVIFGGTIAQSAPDIIGFRRGIAFKKHPDWNTNDVGAGNDISLILLDSEAPVEPIQMNRNAIPNSLLQKPESERLVRLVGFGITNTAADNNDPKKREVDSPLNDLTYNLIGYGDNQTNACSGDSGGPNFMTFNGAEYITGITSFGDQNCRQFGYGTRVDKFAESFVDPWVQANDVVTCNKDGACAQGCLQPDPDCPCANDGFCTAACTDNSNDVDCPMGCGKDGTCTADCPSGAPDPDCGGTAHPCPADGSCNVECIQRDLDCPLGGTGQPCNIHGDCADGICLPAPDDPSVKFCTAYCTVGDATCPTGMECVEADNGQNVCIYDGHTPGAAGAACTESSQCVEGLCLEKGGEQFCSTFCDDSNPCAGGMRCADSSGDQDVCVPEEDGGICSVTVARGTSRGAAAFVGLLALGLMAVRRRRR